MSVEAVSEALGVDHGQRERLRIPRLLTIVHSSQNLEACFVRRFLGQFVIMSVLVENISELSTKVLFVTVAE